LLKAYDVAYFMASTDDAETNRKFAEANGADFPVLADPEKSAAEAYGVLALPGYAKRWTFYIDPQGKIAYVDKDVNALSAGKDIAARLEALGVAKR
jgi:thioredoxin-dependent peroxiredoxin